jgi:hypothetical protein
MKQDERPADGSKLLVEGRAPAAIAATPLEHRRVRVASPPLTRATVEEHLYGLVPGIRACEFLEEFPSVSRDDEPVLGHRDVFGAPAGEQLARVSGGSTGSWLRHEVDEPGHRAPRAASAHGAGPVAEIEALIAVETERQPSEREVYARRVTASDCRSRHSHAIGSKQEPLHPAFDRKSDT